MNQNKRMYLVIFKLIFKGREFKALKFNKGIGGKNF